MWAWVSLFDLIDQCVEIVKARGFRLALDIFEVCQCLLLSVRSSFYASFPL